VNITKAIILKIKPIKPNISGRILIADDQFDKDRGNNNKVSFICKPDVKPTYFNRSCNDANGSDCVSFIFHLK
jgi:hypothetical protein